MTIPKQMSIFDIFPEERAKVHDRPTLEDVLLRPKYEQIREVVVFDSEFNIVGKYKDKDLIPNAVLDLPTFRLATDTAAPVLYAYVDGVPEPEEEREPEA